MSLINQKSKVENQIKETLEKKKKRLRVKAVIRLVQDHIAWLSSHLGAYSYIILPLKAQIFSQIRHLGSLNLLHIFPKLPKFVCFFHSMAALPLLMLT